MKIGNGTISACYVGNTQIDKIYLGAEIAYTTLVTPITMVNPVDVSQTFATYHVDNVANTVYNYSSTFTVNTTTNEITPVTDPQFGPPGGLDGYPKGMVDGVIPVTFTTTGTLPAPLQTNTEYYLSPTTTGVYKIYPKATDADAALLETAITGENIFPAQHYFQTLNAIDITTSGSGTHTVTHEQTLSHLVDVKNGYNMISPSTANRHAYIIRREDGDGDKYIYTGGGLSKNDLSGYYNIYGKTLKMNFNKAAARLECGLKRYVWLMFVCKTRKIKTRNVKKHKVNFSDFNTSTGVITLSERDSEEKGEHKFTTGDKVKFKLINSSVLPTIFDTTTNYFVRQISSFTFTLHSTLADAQSNLHVIIPTNTGSGSYMLYAPTLVGQSQVFNDYIEWIEPTGGGNTLTVKDNATFQPLGNGILTGSTFSISGSTQGEISNLDAEDFDLLRLWSPPGTTLPAQLTNKGLYYVTKKPGSAETCRLHLTMQDAIDSQNIATNNVAFKGIKFTSQPTGSVYFHHDDGKSRIIASLEAGSPNGSSDTLAEIPYDRKHIIFVAIDYNPPVGSNSIAFIKVNRDPINSVTLNRAKGLTRASTNTDANGSPWTFFNSANGHVPVDMDLYSLSMGSSNTTALTETEIENMMNWYADKYTISSY
jgi:hypothetical protein